MEPTPHQAAEGAILVKVLAAVLDRLVNSNTSLALSDPGQVTKFHALKAPGIGVEAYLERCVHSCGCFFLFLVEYGSNLHSTFHVVIPMQNIQVRVLLQRVLHFGTHLH